MQRVADGVGELVETLAAGARKPERGLMREKPTTNSRISPAPTSSEARRDPAAGRNSAGMAATSNGPTPVTTPTPTSLARA